MVASQKLFDKKSVVCYHCDKKGQMKRDCYQWKADEAKGNKRPNCGRRDGGRGSRPLVGAALENAASAVQLNPRKAPASTSGSSTWVLDSRATNHMAAGEQSCTVREAVSECKVTLSNCGKVRNRGTTTSLWT